MKYLKYLPIAFFLLLAGCASTQRAANNATATAKKSKVVKAHEAARTGVHHSRSSSVLRKAE
jgi:outer membrane biogenesis lipoprotein LolB